MKTDNKKSIPIRVGISACLLGQPVRFDSGHKKDRYLTDILGGYFKFIPVCPEIEVGMGVPRESVRLVGEIDDPRMVGNKTGEDWTDRIKKYSQERVRQLRLDKLSGYILKKDSPSCGMERVKVYHEGGGGAEKKGVGMYAHPLMEEFPLMPVEEEGRLNDSRLRENFIVRIFAYNRLINLFESGFKRKDVIDFHTRHKYLLLAHSQKHYRLLGRMVAAIAKYKPVEFKDEYSRMFMETLTYKTTVKKNMNVLQHILGYLKKELSSNEKADILKVLDDYHRELIPLVVPITLLRHYIDVLDVDYIKDQIYLNPHPKELMLRNHV
ncbi:MAG: DUF1722 domain-containing protein [candidate division Zixibacteria bacterium]|nr:DUF1722 domain-containing protein [candidate division Zixibacteria bacterium]